MDREGVGLFCGEVAPATTAATATRGASALLPSLVGLEPSLTGSLMINLGSGDESRAVMQDDGQLTLAPPDPPDLVLIDAVIEGEGDRGGKRSLARRGDPTRPRLSRSSVVFRIVVRGINWGELALAVKAIACGAAHALAMASKPSG